MEKSEKGEGHSGKSKEGKNVRGMEEFIHLDKYAKSLVNAKLSLSVEVEGEHYEYEIHEQVGAVQLISSKLWDVLQSKKISREIRKSKRRSGGSSGSHAVHPLKRGTSSPTNSSSSIGSESSGKGSRRRGKSSTKSNRSGKSTSPQLSPSSSPPISPRNPPVEGTTLNEWMEWQVTEYPRETIPIFVRNLLDVIILAGLHQSFLPSTSVPSKVETVASFILNSIKNGAWDSVQPTHIMSIPLVLRSYLLDILPESVVPDKYVPPMLNAVLSSRGKDSWPVNVRKCVLQLPVHHRNLLQELTRVLHLIHLNHHVNGLSADRLSHYFGPTLMKSSNSAKAGNVEELLKAREDSMAINNVVCTLIRDHPFVFDSDHSVNQALSPEQKDNLVAGYPKLGRLIMSPDLTLVQALSRSIEPNAASVLAKDVVQLFHENGNGTALVVRLILIEIHQCEALQTLFRGNTLATYSMTQFCRLEALGFISSLLRPIVNDLANGTPIEVDPSKIANESALGQCQKMLLDVLEQVITSFAKALDQLPNSLRIVLRTLKEESVKKWGGECKPHSVIGSLLFLRLICPAIVSPEGWDVVENKVSRGTRRSLVLMSKVLQAMSNGTKPKEKYLEYTYAWIDERAEFFHQALEDASVVSDETPTLKASEDVAVDFDGMARFHSYLHENLISIDEEVRTMSSEAQATFKKVMLMLAELPPPPSLEDLEQKSSSHFASSVAPQFMVKLVPGAVVEGDAGSKSKPEKASRSSSSKNKEEDKATTAEDEEKENQISCQSATSSPDGLEIISVNLSGVLASYDVRDMVASGLVKSGLAHTRMIKSVPSNSRHLLLGGDYGLVVWDSHKQVVVKKLVKDLCVYGCLMLGPNSPLMWGKKKVTLVLRTLHGLAYLASTELVGKLQVGSLVTEVVLVKDRLWCGTADGRMVEVDLSLEKVRRSITRGEKSIESMIAVGSLIWCCLGGESSITIWDTETLDCKLTLKQNIQPLHYAKVSQKLVRCGSYVWAFGGGRVHVWDASGHIRLSTLSYQSVRVVSTEQAWNAAKQVWTLWSFGEDGAVCVWEIPPTCGIKRPQGSLATTSVVDQKAKRERKAKFGHRRSRSMDSGLSAAAAAAAAAGGSSSKASQISRAFKNRETKLPSFPPPSASKKPKQKMYIVRPMIADTPFMRNIGLHNTMKTLQIGVDATTEEMHASLIKSMVRGMTDMQKERLVLECEVYQLSAVIDGKSRVLKSDEHPVQILSNRPTKGKGSVQFVFAPVKARISGPSNVRKRSK